MTPDASLVGDVGSGGTLGGQWLRREGGELTRSGFVSTGFGCFDRVGVRFESVLPRAQFRPFGAYWSRNRSIG